MLIENVTNDRQTGDYIRALQRNSKNYNKTKAATGKKKENRSKSEKKTKRDKVTDKKTSSSLQCFQFRNHIFSLCTPGKKPAYLQKLSHNSSTFASSAHSLIIISARAVL